MAEPICIPMNSAQGFFLPHPHQLFDSKHSHWCEIMSDCVSICFSLMSISIERLFIHLLAIFMSFFEQCIIQAHILIMLLLSLFLLLSFLSSLCIFDIDPLLDT